MSMGNKRIVDPVQSRLARGYRPDGFIGSMIFPFVRLDKEGGTIPLFGKEAFRHHKTERAPRANRNEINTVDPKSIKYSMVEHELSAPFDLRESSEAEYDVRTNARILAQDGVLLDHEIACASLATNVANYDSGATLTLSGTDIFSNAASKPLTIIKDAQETVRRKIGRKANASWMGTDTYNTLLTNPQVLAMFPNAINGMLTKEQLMIALGFTYLFVGEGVRLLDDDADDAEEMTDIWGDDMGLLYLPPNYNPAANPNYSELQPYYGYTIAKTGYPQADTWPKEGNKTAMMGYTDLFDVKIVGKDSAFLIKNTKA